MGMHYEGIVIRPPSEAYSILLQVTTGCSHNKCTFCGTYKNQKFRIKSDEEIYRDIDWAARNLTDARRMFICDGDALIIPQKRLVPILQEIRRRIPRITRVGMYANAKSIDLKTPEQLEELRELGVGILYLGLETGDDETLKAIRKGADAEKMIRMGRKVRDAGIRLSVMVLLGLAGKERSQIHAEATGNVLSAIDPEYAGALSLMLIPGTPLHSDHQQGRFDLLTPEEMLLELRTLFASTRMSRGLFQANHASNYLPIRARMPKEKEKTLAMIDAALEGRISLKPEWLRAL